MPLNIFQAQRNRNACKYKYPKDIFTKKMTFIRFINDEKCIYTRVHACIQMYMCRAGPSMCDAIVQNFIFCIFVAILFNKEQCVYLALFPFSFFLWGPSCNRVTDVNHLSKINIKHVLQTNKKYFETASIYIHKIFLYRNFSLKKIKKVERVKGAGQHIPVDTYVIL